jgi:hypothetical protein
LQELHAILDILLVLGSLVTAVVALSDPVKGVWVGWGVALLALFKLGLILDKRLHAYRAGAWLMLVLSASVGFFVAESIAEKVGCPRVEYSGALLPSSLASPRNPCGSSNPFGKNPPDADYVFFGSNAAPAIFQGGRLNLIKVGDRVLLSMNKDGQGFYVSTDLYDADGTLLAKIQDNQFSAVGGTVCCLERPNLSTFIVRTRKGKELLYVRYTNSHAMEIRGFFAYPKEQPVEVTSEAIQYGGQPVFTGDCFGTGRGREVSDSVLIF